MSVGADMALLATSRSGSFWRPSILLVFNASFDEDGPSFLREISYTIAIICRRCDWCVRETTVFARLVVTKSIMPLPLL